MLVLVIVATVVCIPPIIMAVCMTDIKLDGRFSAFGDEAGRSKLAASSERDSSQIDEDDQEKPVK
jgi:hypothetical protein